MTLLLPEARAVPESGARNDVWLLNNKQWHRKKSTEEEEGGER
jgi:hypothetical protein